MARTPSRTTVKVTLAAGGVVWLDTPRGPRVAVVHRPRYDDFTLPKGKLEEGVHETFEQAAVREVKEETAVEATLTAFLGCVSYAVGGAPKVVFFYAMDADRVLPFTPNEEVDELRWVAPSTALRLLSHATERSIVRKAIGALLPHA